MKIPVYFLYAHAHQSRGSVVMRSLQLPEIAGYYLGEVYEFHTLALAQKGTGAQLVAVQGLRDGVIVLSKALLQHLDADAFARLKANNIAILADWIDRPLRSRYLDQIDLHIASSWTQKRYLETQLPGVDIAHVTHHADPRLIGVNFTQPDHFASVYLGNPSNTNVIWALRHQIHVEKATDSTGFEAMIPSLSDYALHYAIRSGDQPEGVCKPFTKGFTAAMCGANILIQRGADDALDYLGDDYPYLVPHAGAKAIRDTFERARDDFGGPDWQRGLNIMAHVADLSSPRQVAQDLGQMLNRVTGQAVKLRRAA